MNVNEIRTDGLCMQCGTCAGVCPRDAVRMAWSMRGGWLPAIDDTLCDDCGICLRDCPAAGFDFSPAAWWRERNEGAPFEDFLGPYRSLWFGWATDPGLRYAGASGGAATAILQGALEGGEIDAAIVVRMSPENPLAAEPAVARTAEEIAAARGSKYNVVAVNELLKLVKAEPGRYAIVGLPCHIQGLRLAQRKDRALRERIVFSLGIFCGWTNLPRSTEVVARRAGAHAEELAAVRYRGPEWPGGMRLETRAGMARECTYPGYYDGYAAAWAPSRCRFCPDALAEAADISVGDTWLSRFSADPAFKAGVSDVIARTPAGERLIDRLRADWLTLDAATPREMIASQSETYVYKRDICRGRRWLRGLAGRRLPDYPGITNGASLTDKWAGARNLAGELWYRALSDLRYR